MALRLLPLLLLAAHLAMTPLGAEPVVLQLKWRHQFQFAGYYAAQAQGYYREAGLEVELREAQPGLDPVAEVLSGRAQYGIAMSELAQVRAEGRPVVAVAAIFQKSPLAIFARRGAGITTIRDLSGKRIMMTPQESEIVAFLQREGLPPHTYEMVPHELGVEGFLGGRCDAYVGYVTDERFHFRNMENRILEFLPSQAGIDFYGDCLFTSEAEYRSHPDRVRAFREASLRGWRYALAHSDELCNLIHTRYRSLKPLDHLRYEAAATAELIQGDRVQLGHVNPERWAKVASVYEELGLIPPHADLRGLIQPPTPPQMPRWVVWVGLATLALLGAAVATAILVLRFNRRLRREAQERASAEAELQAAQNRLHSLIQDSPDGILILRIEPEGRFLIEEANPSAGRQADQPAEALVARPIEEALPAASVVQALDQLREALRAGEPLRFQDVRYTRQGLRHFESLVIPCHAAGGRIPRLALITRDITLQVEAENDLQHREDARRQADKLESLGLMASAIAHDFNNLFQGVLGYLDLAQMTPEAPERNEFLERARHTLGRAAELSRRMLEFSGKGFRETRALDLGDLLRDLEQRKPSALPAHHHFRIRPLEAPMVVDGDAAQLLQVVEALVMNGIEALEDGDGSVEVRAFALDWREQEPREGHWPLVPASGPKACIEVRDTGRGIPREQLNRILDPFYTTKAHGRGLGLAASLGILRAHGAGLQILSERGLGTTARIYLAQSEVPSAAPAPLAPAPAVTTRRRAVLVVDDEPVLRETLGNLLEGVLGLEVFQAADGLEAEDVYRQHGPRIGLILMDATMPRRGGVEAFQAIRAMDPAAQAWLISGYGESFGQETAETHGFLGFLKKPFRLEELKRVITEALPD